MDIEQLREFCMTKKGATEGFPFKNLPETLVFKVGGKMFLATGINTFKSISIRCNPDEIDELRATYPAVQKPSYFSDRHWTRILLDDSIPDDLLSEWIDVSYQIAVSKLTRKERANLGLDS